MVGMNDDLPEEGREREETVRLFEEWMEGKWGGRKKKGGWEL